MTRNYLLVPFLILSLFLIFGCDSGPKVIEAVESAESQSPTLEEAFIQPSKDELHEVLSKEVLHTDRYTYINVTEADNESFWIAMPKNENTKVGEKYYYRGGLLKKNFQSKQFNRVFETLYLVSDVRTQPFVRGINNQATIGNGSSNLSNSKVDASNLEIQIKHEKGVTKIADVVNNKEQYKGQLIRVIGKCTKINPQIMGKNWVHLKDGTADDFDFTVTTQENIMEGMIVTMEGVIAINKDFGAGYKYQLIMEEAKVVGH